jgi:hypothetical protein
MRKILASTVICLAITLAGSTAKAQVDLSTYADPEGFLDVQILTCAQLATRGKATPIGSPRGTAVGTTGSQKSITWT